MIDYIVPDADIVRDMVTWRRDIHRFPELAFDEHRTASKVQEVLTQHGLEVHTGIAGTGLVAVLKGRQADNGRAVMFRADMDALPVAELSDIDHRSQHEGVMHACGHDGHTAMLLGAACYLAQHNDFSGTLYFVFQPAEENFAGAKAMLDDGFLTRFPAQMAFGIHNWPALSAGQASVSAGPVMASHDTFDIVVNGTGGHAACPNESRDPVLAIAQVVAALHTIVGRSLSPLEAGVISVTALSSGNSYNAIPSTATLKGTVRYLNSQQGAVLRRRIEDVVSGIATSSGCEILLDYVPRYPPTVNSAPEAEIARECLASVPGVTKILDRLPPSMCAEDFSFFLEKLPGCYIWLGNSTASSSEMLHSPHYDFNDDILITGANYWVSLTNRLMTLNR
jgi:amidohydrolase